MNERIKELAEQANAKKLDWAYYRGEKRPENAVTLHSIDLELFTELIVRECAYIPIDMWDKAELNADVAVKIEDRIKQHFGVQE